jgi:hypothetical protein
MASQDSATAVPADGGALMHAEGDCPTANRSMVESEHLVSRANVDEIIRDYRESMADVGKVVREQRGRELLSALKHDAVGAGPYPNVTLFEAANRIMTDLVMLHGVRWLLKHEMFPFREYTVEYGHGNEGEHDIVATEGGKALIGEVFNVSRSLFPMKKAASLKKLRASRTKAD